MDADYHYQPLPTPQEGQRTPPFTRILWLFPGTNDQPLAAQLELINVEASPRPYEALSYTWGTDPPSNYLWLHANGAPGAHPLPIRPNLEAALTWIRHATQTRVLWIDALCINQGDVDERTRQVQYMRLVYKHATRVIVWVGVRSPGVELAFELARRLASIRHAGEQQKSLLQQQPGGSHALQGAQTQQPWISCLQDMAPETMQRLHELVNRPYFSRTWCVQEVVAGHPASVLQCEDLEMPFLDLAGSIFSISQTRQKTSHHANLYLWWRVWDAKQPTPNMGRREVEGSLGTMLSLLDSMRSFLATDPRDKIFALQGICDEGLKPVLATTQVMGEESWFIRGIRRGATRLAKGINSLGDGIDFGRPVALRPNYRKPAVTVYIDVTRFMLRKSPRVLDVLHHVAHLTDPEQRGEEDYPSWVPKWFEPRSCHMMQGYFLAGFCDGHFRYFANIHDNPIRGNPQFPSVLSIDGFHVDHVRTVSETVVIEDVGEDVTVSSIDACWSQLFPFPLTPSPTQYQYVKDGQPLDLAFCKAISAHPFGDTIGLMIQGSVTGVDLTMPENFQDQFKESTTDGGRRAKGYLRFLNKSRQTLQQQTTEEEQQDTLAFLISVRVYASNRRVFITNDGRLGLGPRTMKAGDQVVVLFGGRLPFVARPKSDHHIFIGHCYLVDDDVMKGRLTEKILRPKGGPPGPPRCTFNFR